MAVLTKQPQHNHLILIGHLILVLLVGVVSGCAQPTLNTQTLKSQILKPEAIAAERLTQYQQALRYQLQQRIRLAEVAYPLLKNSITECQANTRQHLGIFLHTQDDYSKAEQPAAESLYQLSTQPQILYVLKQGPAQAILQTGDRLLQINDEAVAANSQKTLKQLKSALKKNTEITLLIERDNTEQTLRLMPETVCNYPVSLSNSDRINGFADGSRIIITAGLMRFAREDNQLALIIAHEMAHNTRQHIRDRLANTALGSLLDIALISQGIFSPFIGAGVGGNLYSQSYELEADLEGLRLLHQAGYDIRGLDQFWRAMAELHPDTIEHGQYISHPTTVERTLLMRRAITELLASELPASEPSAPQPLKAP